MTMMYSDYNLSEIPGFNELLNSNDISNSNSNILKLNKMECRSNNSTYKIIRYDKNMLSVDLVPSYGLCRSVIVNSNNKVVSVAPPKSIDPETFFKKYPYRDDLDFKDTIIAEEFVEGTMINVFFDPSIGVSGAWEIATRNTVGATSSFYKSPNSKTFRQMFLEAAKENNLDINNLDKRFCYSYVLQHPENRIVVPFSKPQLYLIQVYRIEHNDTGVHITLCEQLESEEFRTTVKFLQTYEFNSYKELVDKFGSMNTPYDVMGVVIHHLDTGERTKIRNPVYEQVRQLRGNQPKLQYQYLCLRKEGRVKDFLKYYPENKIEFSEFRDQVHLFTDTLYANYCSCYIRKEKPLKEFSEQYRTHMFNIHAIYMNELREKKLFVTNTMVQKYVNELHPSLLMYCLNYHLRKRNLDEKVNTVSC